MKLAEKGAHMEGDAIEVPTERDRAEETVTDAERAGARLAERDADAIDRIVETVGEALADHETISRLAMAAANETGRGHPGAKMGKIATAIDGARTQARDAPTVGVVDRDESRGTMALAHPVGVVGVSVPATHPVVVPAVVSLFALAGRNAVVFAPSPSTIETCDVVVEEIRRALSEAGAPTKAVSMAPAPASKPGTDSLFERTDLVVASGSEATVAAGQRCGTPNACTGANGLVAVSDGSVSPSAVATSVAVGATYDFGAHPAADAAVVTTTSAVAPLITELENEGGYVLKAAEHEQLRELIERDDGESPSMLGNSPRWFTAELDLPPPARRAAFLVVEPTDRDDPIATLPGIPAVAVHNREEFGDVLQLAADLGGTHAAAVHTTQQRHVQRAAERLQPGRLVVNQPGTAAVGDPRNGLPVAPLLGGGSDEGSQLSGGLTATDLVETTTIAVAPVAEQAAPYPSGTGETLRGG